MRRINISFHDRASGNERVGFRLSIFVLLLCWLTGVNFSDCAAQTVANNDEALQGIWKGQFDINGRGPYDFLAVHYEGMSYAYSLAATTVCVGSASLSGKRFQANYQLFAMDGGRFDLASIAGIGSRSTGIQSSFLTQKAQDEGSLQLSYQVPKISSFAVKELLGEWGFVDRDGMSIEATFTEKGTFAAIDSQGCKYQGELAAIESLVNVYKLHLTVTLCASVDGLYQGVGFLDGDGEARNHFKMILANERYGMFYDFRKGAASEYVPLFKDRLRL